MTQATNNTRLWGGGFGQQLPCPSSRGFGGGSGPSHPVPAPRAAPCFPLQSQGRRARLARSLLCLPQRQDLSQSFPCPRSRCRLGRTPLGITPNTPRGQHPHHGSASPELALALHNPPGFYFKQKPRQAASSLLFRKIPLPAGSAAKRKRGGTF